MANLRDIRRRIKSVKNTSQITKAMQLVAAAKMKKAQDQALAGRDYADRLNRVLVDLKENLSEEEHVLLKKPAGKKELVLVVSTDKGLCGGLNTNLLKKVRAEVGEDAEVVTVGRKLRISLGKLGHKIVSDWEVADPTPFSDAKPLGTYSYMKVLSNGDEVPCIGLLFPVRVRLLRAEYPEARERKRKWFSLKKAAKKVDEPELARMIRDFDPRQLR